MGIMITIYYMRKLIFAGFISIFLLAVVCTSGCVSNVSVFSDPIVGTWVVDPDYIDSLKSNYGYSSQLPDVIAEYRAMSLTFLSDGTVVMKFGDKINTGFWKNKGDDLYLISNSPDSNSGSSFYLSDSKFKLGVEPWVKV